ncbi:hypothetical protein [Nonomuraea jiangxiensis]|uniref:Uncharacterized protein n=1 Tax=Nonomuraea jiangxiensis TaxID=633440 RepID=A0A1G9MT95_9ACTN|nr:hypothetical protein [Nonomuraea jiangxiensis]SDL77221.1 hypothetical protein SAMN05421869_130104 [Nonomuraea jiangxiensis]
MKCRLGATVVAADTLQVHGYDREAQLADGRPSTLSIGTYPASSRLSSTGAGWS